MWNHRALEKNRFQANNAEFAIFVLDIEQVFKWMIANIILDTWDLILRVLWHQQEASRRFSMPTPGLESQLKQENFILGSST